VVASARGRILVVGAAASLLLSACGTAPSPSATATPSTGPAPSAPTSPPIPPRPSALDPASADIHLLDARYVPGEAPTSANGQVLWTAGEHFLSDIWRYVPGAAAPERIFTSPRPKANITSVVGSAGGYAFVEQSEPDYGEGGWRVWFLLGPGAEPVQLDAGVARRAGAAPTIAMDAMRVVWAGFDERPTPFVSRLAMASIADPAHVTTLLELPVDQRLIWYPALTGDQLWYASIDPASDPDADGPEYHLEMLDLANPLAAPAPFAGTGHDFNPAVNADYLVWKANRRGDAALNWGTLKILDRRTQRVLTIPADHANRPSIGDRFVTFDEIFHATLPVYDPVTNRVLDLGGSVASKVGSDVTYFGESVSGRLLAFGLGSADNATTGRIGWAILPE